jgi:hypothetical protein
VKRGVLRKNNLKFHGHRQLRKTFGPKNDEVTVKDVIHQKVPDLYRSAIRLLIGHLISYLYNDALSGSDCTVPSDRMTACSIICSLFNDVFSKSDYIESNDWITALKTSVRIVGVPVEIRTRHLSNKNSDC